LKSQAQLQSDDPDALTPPRAAKNDLDQLQLALSNALEAGVSVAELIATITRLREEISSWQKRGCAFGKSDDRIP